MSDKGAEPSEDAHSDEAHSEEADASGEATESVGAVDAGSRLVRGRELARLLQRQAYQRAKEMRAKDPKFLAMKQLAKERRREAGKSVRAKRKAEQVVERAVEKKESSARRAGERAERDQKLKELLTRGVAPAKKPLSADGGAPPSPDEEGTQEQEHAPLLRIPSPRNEYDVN